MDKNKKLATLRETAAALGVCTATIRRWKDCPRVQITKSRYRYNLDAVWAWLEARNRKEARVNGL